MLPRCYLPLPRRWRAAMNDPATRDGDHRPPRVGQLLAEYGSDVEAICDACVRHLPGISGVGVAVMTRLPAQDIRYASNPVSEQIEQLQVVLGEGPCVDAFSAGQPVLGSGLDEDAWVRRWPAFVPQALDAGARALFALPL